MDLEKRKIKVIGDQRGVVIPIEALKECPFVIQRVYFLDQLKSDFARGFHAHKQLEQMMYVLRGGCDLLMDDGKTSKTFDVNRDTGAVLIPKMIWHVLSRFQPDTLIVVFASAHYDESDYIRDYEEFKMAVK